MLCPPGVRFTRKNAWGTKFGGQVWRTRTDPKATSGASSEFRSTIVARTALGKVFTPERLERFRNSVEGIAHPPHPVRE